MTEHQLKSQGGLSSISGPERQRPAPPLPLPVQTGSGEQPWIRPRGWVQLANPGLPRPWVQSHAAIHTHSPLLVWTDSLPRVGPGPLSRSWQLSDVMTRAGRPTLQPKLLINKSHISCLHFCFAQPRQLPTPHTPHTPHTLSSGDEPLRLMGGGSISTPHLWPSLLGLWAWEHKWKSSFKECL